MISRLEILFPDDRLLSSNGKWFDVKGRLSFLENARPEVHISTLSEDIDGSGKLVLRTYAPIWKNGNIEALLIGVTDVEKLPQHYKSWAFGNQVYVYLLEGKSGKFIVDTWHKTLSSMEALGSRKAKPGFSYEKAWKDLMEGRSGNIVFQSRTTGRVFVRTLRTRGRQSLGCRTRGPGRRRIPERGTGTAYLLYSDGVCFCRLRCVFRLDACQGQKTDEREGNAAATGSQYVRSGKDAVRCAQNIHTPRGGSDESCGYDGS